MINGKKLSLMRCMLATVLILVFVSWLRPIALHADPATGSAQLFLPIATKSESVAASEPS